MEQDASQSLGGIRNKYHRTEVQTGSSAGSCQTARLTDDNRHFPNLMLSHIRDLLWVIQSLFTADSFGRVKA